MTSRATLRNPDYEWEHETMDAILKAAWNRYANISHPDINIGWAEYLAEIAAIDGPPSVSQEGAV